MYKITKRIYKELIELKKYPEIKVLYSEDDITNLEIIFQCPKDSVYEHKFIILKIEINKDYPFLNPYVKFIHYNHIRIHPNLYENGKICLSILGTWDGPSWESSMNIESIIRSIMSLLDNDPYKHEPGDVGNIIYAKYVKFITFEDLLFNYLEKTNSKFSEYIKKYIRDNYNNIKNLLLKLKKEDNGSYYCKCYNIGKFEINYDKYICKIDEIYEKIMNIERDIYRPCKANKDIDNLILKDDINNCGICYNKIIEKTILECNHPFCKNCIALSLNKRKTCPLCRNKTKILYLIDYKPVLKVAVLEENENINLELFDFIKDEHFKENYNRHLFTYNKKEIYIETFPIEYFKVETNYGKKVLKIPYSDEIAIKLSDFIKNIEDIIINVVEKNANYYSINLNLYKFNSILKNDFIIFKIKSNIKENKYKNYNIKFKFDRIWKFDYIDKYGYKQYKWGVSTVIDGIESFAR